MAKTVYKPHHRSLRHHATAKTKHPHTGVGAKGNPRLTFPPTRLIISRGPR